MEREVFQGPEVHRVLGLQVFMHVEAEKDSEGRSSRTLDIWSAAAD